MDDRTIVRGRRSLSEKDMLVAAFEREYQTTLKLLVRTAYIDPPGTRGRVKVSYR